MSWVRFARAATSSGVTASCPCLRPGALVAITGAGAYGAVMASNYNSRRSAAEVLVENGRFAVVRPDAVQRASSRMSTSPTGLGRAH